MNMLKAQGDREGGWEAEKLRGWEGKSERWKANGKTNIQHPKHNLQQSIIKNLKFTNKNYQNIHARILDADGQDL